MPNPTRKVKTRSSKSKQIHPEKNAQHPLRGRIQWDIALDPQLKEDLTEKLIVIYDQCNFLIDESINYAEIVLSQPDFKIRLTEDFKGLRKGVFGSYDVVDNAILVNAPHLKLENHHNKMHYNFMAVLQHEFWHAYKSRVGENLFNKELVNTFSKSTIKKDPELLRVFTYYISNPVKKKNNLMKHIEQGLKRLDVCINNPDHCTAPQKKAILSYNPKPEIIDAVGEVVNHSLWLLIKKQIDEKGYLFMENVGYIVDAFYDSELQTVTRIAAFNHPPRDLFKALANRLQTQKKYIEDTIQDLLPDFEELAALLKIKVEVLLDNFRLMELDATLHEAPPDVRSVFWPKLDSYHLRVHKKIFPEMVPENITPQAKVAEQKPESFDLPPAPPVHDHSALKFISQFWNDVVQYVGNQCIEVAKACPNYCPPAEYNDAALLSAKSKKYRRTFFHHNPTPLGPNPEPTALPPALGFQGLPPS